MLLWILIGTVAIGVLGLACSWVLKARGGLEVMQQPAEVDPGARIRADAS